MPPVSRRSLFRVPSPVAAASSVAPVTAVWLLAAARKTGISRRGILRAFAAGAGLCAAAPVVAGIPIFDKDIPIFDPTQTLGASAVGIVFLGDESRVQAGMELLKRGAVEKLLFLSQYQHEAEVLSALDAKSVDVIFMRGAVNTAEEVMAALPWLNTQKIQQVVFVTSRPHDQRCYQMLAPLKKAHIDVSVYPVGEERNRNDLFAERFKLGLTRLGLITRIRGHQIPWI